MLVCVGNKTPILLGADVGTKLDVHSATMEGHVLVEENVKLRTYIREFFATRPSWRSAKRSRKIRYRNPLILTIENR